MGFRLNRIYRLEFEGDMTGAEVRMRGTSVAGLMEIKTAANEAGDRELAELFVPLIVDWNLDGPDGQTLPVTPDGLLQLEPEVFGAVYQAWLKAVLAVPAPLGSGSTSGGPSLEASIPMESLSPSPES